MDQVSVPLNGTPGILPMFERLDDRARKVMALANQEGQRFNHEYIGTEHILLGLVKEGSGVGANVLAKQGIDLRRVRLEVEKLIKSGADMVTMGKLPQTPRAKKVIEYAIESASELDRKYVGTEHLLLGLIREGEGVAAQVLLQLGVTFENAREEIIRQLAEEDKYREDDEAQQPTQDFEEKQAYDNISPMELLVDPGTASTEEIGELLFELSTLYRMIGGSGVSFTMTDVRELQFT